MMKKPEGFTLANYQMEYRKMRKGQEKIGVMGHLSAYIIVNTLLITINLINNTLAYWFIFPLIFWGIGVTIHYTYCVRQLDARLKTEEAKIEQIVKNR